MSGPRIELPPGVRRGDGTRLRHGDAPLEVEADCWVWHTGSVPVSASSRATGSWPAAFGTWRAWSARATAWSDSSAGAAHRDADAHRHGDARARQPLQRQLLAHAVHGLDGLLLLAAGGARPRTPRRPTGRRVSSGRQPRAQRGRERSKRSASPASWPWTSLRSLKWSRSANATAQAVSVRGEPAAPPPRGCGGCRGDPSRGSCSVLKLRNPGERSHGRDAIVPSRARDEAERWRPVSGGVPAGPASCTDRGVDPGDRHRRTGQQERGVLAPAASAGHVSSEPESLNSTQVRRLGQRGTAPRSSPRKAVPTTTGVNVAWLASAPTMDTATSGTRLRRDAREATLNASSSLSVNSNRE